MDPSWIEVAKTYGFPGLIILALGSFLYFKVWPEFLKRLENSDKERAEYAKRFQEQGVLFTDELKREREDNAKRFEDQGRIFMDSLRTQQVFYAETHKEIIQEIRGRRTVRRRNGK